MHGDKLVGCKGTRAVLRNVGGLSQRPTLSSCLPSPALPQVQMSTVLSTSVGAHQPWSESEPEALTHLCDGDGEAVVVGAALGLHGQVDGGVTCRPGRVRQVLASCSRGSQRPAPEKRPGVTGASAVQRGPRRVTCWGPCAMARHGPGEWTLPGCLACTTGATSQCGEME